MFKHKTDRFNTDLPDGGHRSHRGHRRGFFGMGRPVAEGEDSDKGRGREEGRGGRHRGMERGEGGFGRRHGGRGGPGGGMGGGRFGGRFGKGFGGDLGSEGFSRGRKLTADELQLVILALLGEAPAHGYELIRRLEERSGGFYKPSPGVIYPSLTYLEETGLAAVTQEGNRKLYSLTEEGKAHHDAHKEEAARILDILSRIGARMADVREAFSGVNDLDPTLGQAFHDARFALKAALKSRRGADADELRRIVAILNRAAAEIAGPASGETSSENAPAE
ncbi:PadR family transcriptional regulator [Gluconobacter sp. Dm-62]|uniref:PadR family transcriptional regulator n=1 Tax=Gluconobacter sp. Dm-62 TaxID=2799804 RepID=UPI001B8B2556|nr:PadR family transcriptional regulator [Gluconobacter sp. Dm-62]MBS1102404.1 PadR family transcriptional regulator [Gluconobacter sp. Dm-62]